MAVTITIDGETYKRIDGTWIGDDYMVAHKIMQDKLNHLYYETVDLSMLDLQEIISAGDSFKKSTSYGLAIRLYEYAIAKSDRDSAAYILPRITSCYRQQGRAEDAIELASTIKSKYGTEMFSPILLTSIAAAYCDLEEYDKARKCCDHAYAKFGGKASGELTLVYKRIDAETK